MATKIFYNDNRIIIDGHADTPQECQAITAMCDEMANSENFKTIVYEQGHAVFERIGGADRAMFLDPIRQCNCNLDEYLKSEEAKGIYLTQTDAASWYATKTLLNDAINEIKSALGSVDPYTQGSVAQQLGTLNTTLYRFLDETHDAFRHVVERLAALENKTEYTLPYTASELVEKLNAL